MSARAASDTMTMIRRLTGLLRDHGVKPSVAESVVHGFALGIDRAKNGSPLPFAEGLTREIVTVVSEGLHDEFHFGHDCPMGELQAGDIIVGLTGHNEPYNTSVVLSHNRKERTIRLGRPYGEAHGYGWTGQTMMTGAEVYMTYYAAKVDEQKVVKVVGKDTPYTEHRKLVYACKSLDEIRQAWYIIHKAIGKDAPEPPTNEWELRHKTWELEYVSFFGTDVKGIRHLPVELAEMD